MLLDLGSDHLPILPTIPPSPVLRPNERPPSFNFQKARWDDFVFYFDSHYPSAEEYSSLSLFSAAAFFTSLIPNVASSSIPFGCIKRHPKAWWFPEVEEAVSERRKVFAAAHSSDKDRQIFISTCRCASSVIAKAMAEAWQTTCSSLSPKSSPKFVYPLLCSIAGSSFSFSSSLNFPKFSSPRESASVFADYLRSHFLSPRQRPCVAEPETTFPSSTEPSALWSLTHPFSPPSPLLNFLRLSQTSPCPLLLAQAKLPIP